MNLNLHIISTDLDDLHPHAHLRSNRLSCKLKYPLLYREGTALRADCLYLVTAEELGPEQIADIPIGMSVLCVGEPSFPLEGLMFDFVWVEAQITLAELLDRVSHLFYTYIKWHESLQMLVGKGAPLRELGELSEPIFRRTMWMFDAQFQTIFTVVNEERYELPETFIRHDDFTSWPVWEVNAVDERFERGTTNTEPYILPPVFGYRSLCQNIFVNGKLVATFTTDEIGAPLCDRDFALIAIFGKVMTAAMEQRSEINYSMTLAMDVQINQLLDRMAVDEEDIAAELKHRGWRPDDVFLCIVVAPTNHLYPDRLLGSVGESICAKLPDTVCTLRERTIVLITNLSKAAIDRAVLEKMLEAELGDLQADVGISTIFDAFEALYHYYRQAELAIEYGREHAHDGEAPGLYAFDDYRFECLIKRSKGDMPVKALLPSELKRLIAYDDENGTDFLITLRAYLENNMQIAETARQLFLHRNTFLYRLEKIRGLLDTDLDDPQERLMLLISFQIMDLG